MIRWATASSRARASPRSRSGSWASREPVRLHLEAAPHVGLEVLAPDPELGQPDGVLLGRPRRPVELGLAAAKVVRGAA